jgi:glycosyltransferase involved in cell wall biosynthesis
VKIAAIVDEPYDSGITHYALRACEGLAARGHSVSVWGLEGRPPLASAARAGLETVGYSHAWLDLPRLRARLRESQAQLLVAHTGSAHTLAVALAAWHRGRDRRIPVLRTRGDSRAMRLRPGGRFLWARTDGFLAANEKILGEYRSLFGDGERPSAVVYEGTEDPGPPTPPENGPVTIGVVARLDPVKGHATLLKAAAGVVRACPEARLLIVGKQENVSRAELEERASALGIADHVELTGRVPNPLRYMSRCHIGVVASIGSEAVSRAAVEWMAAGRPLVATRVGCLPEYVVEGETGALVEAGDPQALAKALLELAQDPFLRERRGAAARRRFEERFRLERFWDETEKFYEDAVHAVSSR